MTQVKILTIKKDLALVLIRFALLLGIATLAPFFGNQAITGPIVNAALFLSVVFLGPQGAILVGLMPSLIALSIGLLPAILVPMVPFIMVGNTISVLVFSYLREKNYWLGAISASLLKFIFLAAASSIVIDLLLKKEIAQKVAMMMIWPQFLTALGGGLIACLFLKSIKRI